MQERLLNWFDENKRTFNFRDNRNAYRVWVAEVMLQQTRAKVVEGYFAKFMNKWPTIESLSKANEEEVLKAFEGLGYYSRAKRLLAGARQIQAEFNGQIPSTRKELLSIQGIGHYTAGAILAFAYNQAQVALDGNVIRVMSRLIGYEGLIKGKSVMDTLTNATKKTIEHKRGHEVMEALIELGATICNKKSLCYQCPVMQECMAYKKQLTQAIPLMPQRKKTEKIFRAVAVVEFENQFVINQVQEGQIMSSLYEFCYIEHKTKNACYGEKKGFEKKLSCKLELIEVLKEQTHSFTHFKATLIAKRFKAKTRPHGTLKSIQEIERLALSSGHKKIFNEVMEGFSSLKS